MVVFKTRSAVAFSNGDAEFATNSLLGEGVVSEPGLYAGRAVVIILLGSIDIVSGLDAMARRSLELRVKLVMAVLRLYLELAPLEPEASHRSWTTRLGTAPRLPCCQ